MSTAPLLPIVRPALGDEEVAASARVIRSGWITQGPEVAAFEGELAAAVGAKHAAAVANCTVALELALRALGVGAVKGRVDEVVTVSHSFIATANAVVSAVPDPMTNNYRYKLGRGVLSKVGESPYKHSFTHMSLKPRNIV